MRERRSSNASQSSFMSVDTVYKLNFTSMTVQVALNLAS